MKKYFDVNGEKETAGGAGYLNTLSNETVANILSNMPDSDNQTNDRIEDLGKVDTEFDRRMKENETNMKLAIDIGFKSLSPEILPSKGKFYPADCMISIRPASVAEVKHFSSMNEEDYIDAEDKVIYVLEKCVRLVWGGEIRSSLFLKEADKLYLLFTIRDLTMVAQGKENKIMMNPQCPHCGEKMRMELVNNIFGFYDIPAAVMNYYSEEMRCIIVPIPTENLKVFVPNIGVVRWIKKFIIEKEIKKRRNEDDAFYDKMALTYAQFLIENPNGISETYVKKLTRDMAEEWPLEKTEVMQYLVDKLTFAIKPTITVICKDKERGVGCEKEFSAPITFRQGLRYLFSVTGITTKLFGDTE